ncbi:exo-alpha-sialidase [Paenibacillus contaminans]|uniref:Dockerin domain-containing protein n=1 Tax=Paenibacillus contaminans TaxID=450362 RepID=A0A329LQN7_9BACL|nr:exo-alpha-sialidase [Paenibacillus contaminans]RAV09758.1 hypothetical protein DQG23_38955 [Paenibacillus contaminans]
MNKMCKTLLVVMLFSLLLSMQAYAAGGQEQQKGPVFESTLVEANESTTTKRAFNSAIFELTNNRLLLTYDDYTDVMDASPGVISGKISEDGGRTWGEKFLIQENIGQKNVTNQGIVRLKTGELALFFAKQDDNAEVSMYMKRSADEGLTWGQPRNITPYTGHHVTANDRAVMLSSGRIILPLGGKSAAQPGKTGAFAIYSDDDGETWTVGPFVNMPTGAPAEPVLVELKDKRVMLLIRSTLKYIYKAYSDDGGTTWGDPVKTDLNSPYTPQMVKRIPDNGLGPLLLIWNNVSTEVRRPLTMALSGDEGETWTNFINLTPSNSGVYAYPSITTYRDEVLITYYTYNPLPDGKYTLPLKLQIWKLADITAGTGFGNAASLTADASNVQGGETFKVRYGLSSVSERVYAQDVTFAFDPSSVEFVSAASVKSGVNLLETSANPNGTVQLILASAGPGNEITGQGDIVELTFKAKFVSQTTASEIRITDAALADGQGVEYVAELSSVSIQVTAGLPGDINQDNKVTVGDLAIMAANYGKNSGSPDWEQVKRADLNGDGKIDIEDLAILAKKVKR